MPSISLPILSMALPLQSVLTHNLPMFCQRVTAKEFQVFFSLSATKTEYSKATTTLTLTAKKIDFEKVNEKISAERKKSLDILKNMIGD